MALCARIFHLFCVSRGFQRVKNFLWAPSPSASVHAMKCNFVSLIRHLWLSVSSSSFLNGLDVAAFDKAGPRRSIKTMTQPGTQYSWWKEQIHAHCQKQSRRRQINSTHAFTDISNLEGKQKKNIHPRFVLKAMTRSNLTLPDLGQTFKNRKILTHLAWNHHFTALTSQ